MSADVSVPGWWSYMTLDVETAWISNWQVDTLVMDSKNALIARKNVSFPEVTAIFDSLTDFIATKLYGPQNTRIFASYVRPSVLPSCSTQVTLQIGGANIWRANSILLGGVPADSIAVLPDMNGVLATFSMAKVLTGKSTTVVQAIPLLVSSEQGSATPLNIYVVGTNSKDGCSSPISAPTTQELLATTVFDYSPRQICSDAKTVPVLVRGVNLPSTFEIASSKFDGVKASKGFDSGSFQFFTLTLKKEAKLLPTESIPVFLLEEKHTSVAEVELAVGDCSEKNGQSPAQSGGPVVKSVTYKAPDTLVVQITPPSGAGSAITGYTAQATDTDVTKKADSLTGASSGTATEVDLTKCVQDESYTVTVIANTKWPEQAK